MFNLEGNIFGWINPLCKNTNKMHACGNIYWKKKLKNKYIIVGFRIQRLDLKASYMYSHYIYIYFPFINQWWILNI